MKLRYGNDDYSSQNQTRSPQADANFGRQRLVQSRQQLLQQLIDTAPKDVPLTDEDILEEIQSIRANRKQQ